MPGEWKPIFHMIINVILAVIVLGTVSLLIITANKMLAVLDKQKYVTEEMYAYSNYAAYSESIIYGQELVSLISKTKGNPFIIVVSNNETGSPIVRLVYSNESNKGFVIDLNSMTDFDSSSSGLLDLLHNKVISELWSDTADYNLTNIHKDIISLGNGDYGQYKTHLVYSSDTSTEVVGILAIKE